MEKRKFLTLVPLLLSRAVAAAWSPFRQSAAARSQQRSLLADLQRRLARVYRGATVKVVRGQLRVVLADRAAPLDSTYHGVLTTVCDELAKHARQESITEIAVVNSFERVGWVYERPDRCHELLSAKISDLALLVARDTHAF